MEAILRTEITQNFNLEHKKKISVVRTDFSTE